MNSFLLVAAGGAIGASLRYGAGLVFGGTWSTLLVNLIGSFTLGLLTAWGVERNWPGEETVWLFLGVGLLGAFTTFSAFSRETVYMFMEGETWRAIVYMAVNLLGSVGAFALALFTLRKLIS